MPHLVLALAEESIDWLEALAPDWRITVYHAGPAPDISELCRPVTLRALAAPPAGATASALLTEAILQHVPTHADAQRGDLTVFAPGDALDHAPDLPALLDLADRFADVQPLSTGTGLASRLAQADGRDWIDHWAVRAERFSLTTLVPLTCASEAAVKVGRAYRRKHALADGTNLLAHFLGLLGLTDHAEQAADADLGLMAHGPVFAVRNHLVAAARDAWGHRADALRLLVRADHNYPDLFQQSWLHIFGLPFVSLGGLSDALAEPRHVVAAGMERVVASIDAVLAHSEPPRRLPRALEALGPPVLSEQIDPPPGMVVKPRPGVPELRERAHQAASTGDLHMAWSRLDQALQLAPQDVDLLADATALAYQQGDIERAMHCARRALSVDPQHLDCLFTLGMCLAASGQTEAAMDMLAQLGEHPQAAAWQAAHPDMGDAMTHALSGLGMPSRAGNNRRVAA